jgi:hypothetical protein
MKHSALLTILMLTVVLAGCGDVADTLGFGRHPPDEFAVVDRPPLALPPDFELRPPKPGAPRPQDVDTTQRASTMLFGPNAKLPNAAERNAFMNNAPAGDDQKTDAEKALLEASGADKAEPGIREIVDREASQKVVGSPHLVDELLWWRKDTSPATTVDAPAEAERIKEDKEKGKPLNEGATPIIERQKSGWLGL